MPSRRICLILLLFWTYAAWNLFRRDILPDLIVGPPPDLRAIARADTEDSGPVRWAILVVDNERSGEFNGRSIGQVVTETIRQRDGGVRLVSHAWFDTGQLFGPSSPPPPKEQAISPRDRGDEPHEPSSPSAPRRKERLLGTSGGDRLEIYGACWIDRSGNLDNFHVSLREARTSDVDLLVIDGRLKNDRIEITTTGLVPYLGPHSFPYKPHGMVQSTFGPLDRLPRLHVGQNWESQVVSPLTGQVVTGRVEVVGTKIISWDSNPVTTLEVVTKAAGLTARTWVRRDGLVLRQEVPIPFVKLVLERVPENVPSVYFGEDRP